MLTAGPVLSRTLLPAKTPIMIWRMNAQGWGWPPWLCWSRAFTIPYFNWRAGTNGSILVENAWLYGRNQRVLDSLPVPTPSPPPDGISITETIQVSSVNSTSPLKLYPILYPISYYIVYNIVSDMFLYRVQCIRYIVPNIWCIVLVSKGSCLHWTVIWQSWSLEANS